MADNKEVNQKPPAKRSRPAQKRGLQTRETLVLAATQALVESNIYALRFAHVAKIAKVPQPLVDYHFASLEDLLMAMVVNQLHKLKDLSIEAIERNSTHPRKAMAAYIRAPFELAGRDAGFRAVWSSYYHLAAVNKTFADFNRVVREGGHDRIQMLIQNILVREQRSTSQPRHLTSQVANAIQGLITGCAFIAIAETGGDFKNMGNVVVKGADQLIDSSFPLNT